VDEIRDALSEADMALVGLANDAGQGPRHPTSERLEQWLDLPYPPSALVCGSDAAAAAALRECGTHGIAVPQRLSIIGFGDSELARHTRPTLSTLRLPAEEAGIAAADFLLATLRGEAFAAPKLRTKVVARESTGPAADSAD